MKSIKDISLVCTFAHKDEILLELYSTVTHNLAF